MASLEERQRSCGVGTIYVYLQIKVKLGIISGLMIVTDTGRNRAIMYYNVIILPVLVNIFEVFFLHFYMGMYCLLPILMYKRLWFII